MGGPITLRVRTESGERRALKTHKDHGWDMPARRLRRTDYYGWLSGRIGRSITNEKTRRRGQWSIAGDIGFRPTYQCD